MTRTTIFIKTWTGDLEWLPYCLDSIHKYGSGFDNVIVVSDRSCLKEVQDICLIHSLNAYVIPVNDWDNGYVQQQWVKLHADSYTESEYILYVDSDCVFHTPFTPNSFMQDGLPILMKTKYGNLEGAEAWKKITEDFVNFPVEYEYMRRLPWMYRSDTLKHFRNCYPQIDDHLKSLTTRDFSEFNVLGAFIDKHEAYRYMITDTEVWIPPSVARQFWSWGTVTNEVRKEIEGYLL